MPGSATTTSAGAWSEAEAAGTTETGTEAARSARAETAAGTTETVAEIATFGDVFADMVAEVTTGIAAVFVQGATVDGASETGIETESEGTAWGCEWGSHV